MEINQPQLLELIQCFLYDQLYPDSHLPSSNVSLSACPTFSRMISVYSSAAATYCAPSDPSGAGSMCWEHIQATSSWQQGPACYNCAFINSHPDLKGMHGLDVIHILLFFLFTFEAVTYPCALVHWFSLVNEEHDEDTSMWVVQPEVTDGLPIISVTHLNCIFQAAHLLPVFGDNPIPENISPHNSLDTCCHHHIFSHTKYNPYGSSLHMTRVLLPPHSPIEGATSHRGLITHRR
jgi:hypothetical protein